MAFVSVREFAIKALGREAEQPNVVFRISKSGSANGRFNNPARLAIIASTFKLMSIQKNSGQS